MNYELLPRVFYPDRYRRILDQPEIMRFITVLLVSFLLMQGIITPASSQQRSNDFNYANELMRQGEYERAFEIFYELYEDQPGAYPVFENAIQALIHLRDFEKAIEITKERLSNEPGDINTKIKLGELYNYNGERGKAREVWTGIVEAHSQDVRIYRQVARAMRNRRDFEGAIEIYEMAREERNNPLLFINELAETYLAETRYEDAMREFLELIDRNQHYVHTVKRQLMRYDEPELFNIAILETEDAVDEHRTDYDTANNYRNLLIWLYSERELYDRALATAKAVEQYPGEEEKHAVFELAYNLRGEHEYELAEEAYLHYIDQQEHEFRSRSMEELAQTYQHWARYLLTTNRAYSNRLTPLYENATETLENLINDYPNYNRMEQVIVIQSELALDYLHDVEKARIYADKLPSSGNNEEMEAYRYYLEGRIKIFEGELARARVALTRSNRIFNTGEMAERTSYYLSLCDFFNGDFEYSRMQLRNLERQHTSFYANDALQLRIWIQDGTQQDNTLPELELFAKARYNMHTGNFDEAGSILEKILLRHQRSPLNAETLLTSLNLLSRTSPAASLALVEYLPADHLNPASKERVLWERARLAHHLIDEDYQPEEEAALANETLNSIFPEIATSLEINFPEDPPEVIGLYEELLIQFPHGFYASQAREHIRNLEEQHQRS